MSHIRTAEFLLEIKLYLKPNIKLVTLTGKLIYSHAFKARKSDVQILLSTCGYDSKHISSYTSSYTTTI